MFLSGRGIPYDFITTADHACITGIDVNMVNWYVWTRALFAAFGGFTFGYDLGAINGVKDMVGFRQTFNLSSDQGSNGSESMRDSDLESSAILGLIAAVLSIGCFIGALLAGAFSDFAGRKVAIIVGGLLYAVGGVLQTAAFFIWMMFLGRFIGGLGVGILYVVVPVYITEISPKKLRGRLVSFNSINLCLGFLVGTVVNLVCERFIFGWRISLSLEILIGSIIAFGMLFLPETPRWLVKKHKEKKAAKVLARIYQTDEKGIEEELSGIGASVVNTQKGHFWQKLKVFRSWKFIQRVILGMCLQFFNRAAGGTSIAYYSVSIFRNIGAPGYIASVVIGVVVIVATVCTIFTIDKLGRKVLLLLGGLGMLFPTATAATLILVFRLEEEGNTAVGYIVVALICFFLFSFAYGWGPVTWVINGEIHPLEVRGIAVSLTSSTYWVGNFIFAQVTPILLASSLQTYGTFYLFAGIHVAAMLFTLLTLPETKGETLERIELLFSKPWLRRINLIYYLRCGCLCFCSKQKRTAYRVGDSRGEESKQHDILSNGVVNILALKTTKEDELEDTGSDTCEYPDHHEYLVQYLTPL